ncbi:hypothetical protein CW304_06540 [Bacillus sp. UFRGS-B20]|nr:hypothetical protein CW304_06540 [Bacillus sp. UFRGS-B20]
MKLGLIHSQSYPLIHLPKVCGVEVKDLPATQTHADILSKKLEQQTAYAIVFLRFSVGIEKSKRFNSKT